MVSETWFTDGSRLEQETEHLLLGHGLRLQTLNRPPLVSGVSYGGVAIITRENCTRSTLLKFPNPECFEVLTTSITHPDIKQKIFVTAAYIPPNYTVPRGKQCLQHISDVVLHIKNTNPDPLVLVAGDFNQWDIAGALSEFSDLEELSTPATRGDRHIDKIFMNWPEHIHEGGCVPPLETEEVEGVKTFSDHRIQYLMSRLPRREPVKWETITFRHYTRAGEEGFLSDLGRQDWSPLLSKEGPNAKVELLHHILEDLVGKHFPLKTVTRKDSDLPWFDHKARGMAGKRLSTRPRGRASVGTRRGQDWMST